MQTPTVVAAKFGLFNLLGVCPLSITHINKSRFVAGIVPWLLIAVSPAQTLMDEVTVTATRGEQQLGAVPAAISVVGEDIIQLGQQQLTLDESLVRVPGVFLQNRNNFSQAQRISIRGFGARSPFGIRGIRLIIDGIPATLPDGQGNVDEIDLGSASRIEVIRGPASSLYGTASGGVINIFTEDGPDKPYLQGRVSVGEYGYQQYQLKAAGQYQRLNYVVSGSDLNLDGYRDNSFISRKVLNTKLRYDIDSSSDITATVNMLDIPDMGDPGALNANEVRVTPRAASPTSITFDGSESRSQQKLGLLYRKQFGENHQVLLRNYYTQLDFENKLSFAGGIPQSNGGQVEFDRFFAGLGGQYTYSEAVLDHNFRVIAGFEADFLKDDRRRYSNLAGGLKGVLTMDQREAVESQGIYAQTEFSLLENLQLTLGARYDQVEFEITDRFLLNVSGDDTGKSNFERFSPSAGLLWAPVEFMNIYVNFSTAFETPTTTEFANPDGGGFNPDLTTQTADSYEIGMKGGITSAIPIDYELSFFRLDIKNEILPFEVDGFTGRTFYRNAGLSSREGVEAAISAKLMPALQASLAWSYIDARFDLFRTATENLDGNKVPGVPTQHMHAELRYDHQAGWYSTLDLLYVDELYADNANLVSLDPYAVSNLRLGYRKQLNNWLISPFMSVNNLFNEEYNSNVRINATFGRYYEPAPLRNFSGGVTARITF